jgi:hypothetical protein
MTGTSGQEENVPGTYEGLSPAVQHDFLYSTPPSKPRVASPGPNVNFAFFGRQEEKHKARKYLSTC